MCFIKYSNWCDSSNNVYAFLVIYVVNYSNFYDQLQYYCNTLNKINYQVRVIRISLRVWNVLVQYCIGFFSDTLCVHYCIQQVQVPYNSLLVQVQVCNACSCLNNNINNEMQYTYINNGTSTRDNYTVIV